MATTSKAALRRRARLIPLSQGQFAKVDHEDYEWLSRWKWYAHWSKHTHSYYAVRNQYDPITGKQRQVRMHREILGLRSGDKREVDHQNHDTLDNRKSKNIIIATRGQNAKNKRVQKNNKCNARGVTQRPSGMYRASIVMDGKTVHLGQRCTVKAASKLYQNAAKKQRMGAECL
jgi:hypothetical protein